MCICIYISVYVYVDIYVVYVSTTVVLHENGGNSINLVPVENLIISLKRKYIQMSKKIKRVK